MAELIGQIFVERYLIEKELGQGAMGTVYRAFDQQLGRRVAIKVLNAKVRDNTTVVERFKREARALAKLSHNNIVAVYDIDIEDDDPFIIMQYLSGKNLEDGFELLENNPTVRPSIQQVINVVQGIASALHHAHQKGIIHRDVKPSNVMFDDQGQAILTDFGIARLVGSNTSYSIAGSIIGTPMYMSPEQCRSDDNLTQATDQYALAILTFQLITGKLPFNATSIISMINAHLNETPATLSSIRSDVPQELSDTITRAMSKNPDDRYPSTIDFANALSASIADITPEPSSRFFDTLLESNHELDIATALARGNTTKSFTQTVVSRIRSNTGISLMITLLILGGVLAVLFSTLNQPTETAQAIAVLATATPQETSNDTEDMQSAIDQALTSTAIFEQTINQYLTETVSFEQTIDASLREIAQTTTAEFITNQTATATLWTATPTVTNTLTQTPTSTNTLTQTPTSTNTLTQTPTSTNTPTQTPTSTSTPTLRATKTDLPPPTVPPLPTMPADTSASRSTTSTLSEQQAFTAVFNNNDWGTIERDFNGVAMVLVPVGCFTMGHNEGLDNEKPEHEQCFDQPFWIDKYEVSNRQFQNNNGYAGRGSYWGGADYPRDSITWIESRDYCASRGARLPTEREWEYAARGPSNWLYPWGNQYDASRVVDGDTSGGTTKSVGSRPSGQSWIGAMDMAGNLYEWTSSKYIPASGSWIYPYNPTDGREDNNDTVTTRVMRGGAWAYTDTWNASTRREVHDTTYQSYGIGLRCVKDY